MSGANKGLVLAVVACLGLWGCAKGPANVSGAAERIKAMEFKIGKLEDDFRAAAAARDALRDKLGLMDSELQKQTEQVRLVIKERDDLRRQIVARTSERDNVQTQYEQFRKGVRELLGQAEAGLGTPPGQPVTAAVPSPSPGKS